jgi:putative transposase
VAYCILPDHIHLIWQLPDGDADYSKRINAVKRRFSLKYQQRFKNLPPKSSAQIKRRESTVWQRRYWEHYIRDEVDFQNHLDYVHLNPVKHGLVSRVRDWEASSFFSYINLGVYDLDWGDKIKNSEIGDRFGE